MEGDLKNVKRPKLAKHDSKILDLAFAMDCTGSMGSYIESARQNIRKIVEEIVAGEKSDIHLALVEYRDHPPQDSTFVTRTNDFTPSSGRMKQWLSDSSAQGGGDSPEAVADALQDVLKLSWRDEATKICVLISDAPPHGLQQGGDGFPDGCPAGIDPMEVVQKMAEKGITLYVVGCEPSISPYKDFFMGIAYITGGQYVPLGKAQLLSKVIIGGALEELSLEQLMDEANEEVTAEMQAGREIDVDEVAKRVQEKLTKKGVVTKQLQQNNAELSAPSASAVAYSGFTNMADVRKNFKPAAGSSSGFSFGGAPPPPGAPMPMFGGFTFGSSAPPPPPVAGMPMGGAFSFGSHGAPRPAAMAASSFGFGGAPTPESYDVAESAPSYYQAQRLVQKSVARNFAKKKGTE